MVKVLLQSEGQLCGQSSKYFCIEHAKNLSSATCGIICTLCTPEASRISPFTPLSFSSISRRLVTPYRMDVYNSYLFPPREAVNVYMPCRYTPKRCLCVVSTAANSAVIKHPDNAWWEQGGTPRSGQSGGGSFAPHLCFHSRDLSRPINREGWERQRCGEL